MNDGRTRLAVACPACSPDEPVVHELLRPGGTATVRCRECNHVHKTRVESERTVSIPVIISHDGESISSTATVPAEEELAIGEEFVQETADVIHLVRITSIECAGDRRVDRAPATDIETLWTRAVDNVGVNVTIHPSDGRRDQSRSATAYVPGDYEFTVGDSETIDDERITVTLIHIRDDATGYGDSPIDRPGATVPAKDVKRLYGIDETDSGWSAW